MVPQQVIRCRRSLLGVAGLHANARSGSVRAGRAHSGGVRSGGLLALAFATLLSPILPERAGATLFDAAWGISDGADYTDVIDAVDTDSQGNVYIAGTFTGKVTVGIGGPTYQTPDFDHSDTFIAKLSPTGQHIWSHQGVGDHNDAATEIDVFPNGDVVVVGTTRSQTFGFDGGSNATHGGIDAFGARFNSNGSVRWQSVWGGADTEEATGVAFDPTNGHTIVVGNFWGTANFGNGQRTSAGDADWFLLDITSTGSLDADIVFGGTGGEREARVAVDPTGAVVFLGSPSGPVDLGNGTLPSVGSYDIVLGRFSQVGTPALWSQRFGGSGSDTGRGVCVAENGAIFIAGSYSQTIDFGSGSLSSDGSLDGFVAAFKEEGVAMWSRSMGGPGEDRASHIDIEGSLLAITGFFNGTAWFGQTRATTYDQLMDSYVATLDTDGDWQGLIQGRGPGWDFGLQVALHGTPIAVGAFGQWVDFGSLGLSTAALQFSGFVVGLTDQVSSVPGTDQDDLTHGMGDPLSNALQLSPAQPNPFRTETFVRFRIGNRSGAGGGGAGTDDNGTIAGSLYSSVRATVHDASGRAIRSLTPDLQGDSGEIRWDGRDRSGVAVPSGVYFLRMATPEGATSIPVTLQR
ncbi:MAG: hypothetical protein R3E97_11285 [Candidatus Eisenbacteria bacterium]